MRFLKAFIPVLVSSCGAISCSLCSLAFGEYHSSVIAGWLTVVASPAVLGAEAEATGAVAIEDAAADEAGRAGAKTRRKNGFPAQSSGDLSLRLGNSPQLQYPY